MAVFKQGDILSVKIEDQGTNGEGIAKEQGFVIFVEGALIDERVKIKIDFVKKDFAYAHIVEILNASPHRVYPECNRYPKCGGCDLLHMAYHEQLEFKRRLVANTLKKYAGKDFFVNPCVPSKDSLYYRNKVQLPFGVVNGKAAVGFFRKGSHKIVSMTKCFLHGSWLQKLIEIVLDFVNAHNISVYDEQKHAGLLRHLVARYVCDQLCVTLVINGDKLPYAHKLAQKLLDSFSAISFYLCVNTQKTNVIMTDKLKPVIDRPLEIEAMGVKAKIGPLSFLQVNDAVRDEIYKEVMQKACGSDIVFDIYGGIGLLGAALAKRGVKKVYNIEIVRQAVKDADKLAAENMLSDRITNICGDAAVELPKVMGKALKDKKDAKISVIVDPPRKGLNTAVIDTLVKLDMPLNLIYISCNPATLARDLALLTQNGDYDIISITPYDMFPQTRHVECLVLMSRVEK